MGRKREKYGPTVAIEGNPWTYRRPLEQGGRWRVDRRDRTTGKVQRITLDIPVGASRRAATQKVIELAEEERRARGEPGTSLPPDPGTITLGEALRSWAETWVVRPATRVDYEASSDLYKRALGKDKLLREITLGDLEGAFFRRNHDADPPGWADRSGRTLTKHKLHLAKFWRWAVAHRYCDVNLPELIATPKAWRDDIRRAITTSGQALTLDEARLLLRKCREKFDVNCTPIALRSPENETTPLSPPSELWLFVFLALRTGLRASNLLPSPASGKPGLTWGMVNLAEKTLRIEPEMMKGGELLYVPMSDEVAEVLQDRLRRLGHVPGPTEPVIGQVRELRKSFDRALTRAKLGDRGFRRHDLRHCFATALGEHCTEAVCKALLGHARTGITDRYSRHLTIDAMREQLNRLPRLLPGRAKRSLDTANA